MTAYKFYPTKKLIELNNSGTITRDDIIKRSRAVVSDSRWEKGYHIISDFSKADISALNDSDIRAISQCHGGMKDVVGDGKVALIGMDDLTFGILRMWEAAENTVTSQCRVFRSRVEAERWIGTEI